MDLQALSKIVIAHRPIIRHLAGRNKKYTPEQVAEWAKLAQSDHTVPLLAGVCALLNGGQRVEEARAAVDKMAPQADFYWHCANGLTLGAEGKHDAAISAFKSAATWWASTPGLTFRHHLIHDFQGAFSVVSASEAATAVAKRQPALRHEMICKAQHHDFIVYAAGDPVYVAEYAASAAASLLETHPEAGYHVLVGAQSEAEARVATAHLPDDPRIGWSWAPVEIPEERAAYFTMLRFFHLFTVRDIYAAPLVVVDLDMRFTPALAAVANASGVTLNPGSRLNRFMPWTRIQAGIVGLGDDGMGTLFADGLTSLAKQAWARPSLHRYHIDQNVLHALDRLFELDSQPLAAPPYIGVEKSHVRAA